MDFENFDSNEIIMFAPLPFEAEWRIYAHVNRAIIR